MDCFSFPYVDPCRRGCKHDSTLSCTTEAHQDPLLGTEHEVPGPEPAVGMLMRWHKVADFYASFKGLFHPVKMLWRVVHQSLFHCVFIKLPIELWLLGTMNHTSLIHLPLHTCQWPGRRVNRLPTIPAVLALLFHRPTHSCQDGIA